MKLLITGALGHIGSRFIHDLRPGEFSEVVLLDNLATLRYCSLFNLPANDASDSPDINPDGRFVAYRSTATNIVGGDINGAGDVFLYDRLTVTTTLLSVSQFGGARRVAGASRRNSREDGHQVFFQSWASDLAGFDFNQSGDVFAYPMFYAEIVPGGSPAQGPTLSWPAVAGRTYHVQFLDDLSLTNWQNAGGSVTIVDETAYFTDPAPAAGQRFYRIVAN